MNIFKFAIVLAALLGTSACVPNPGDANYGAYQEHKANHQRYMGQGR